jgi:predicted nucleic acid-binding protein
MRADFHVLIDACVLANQGVCDLLLSLAERPRLFVPHWSARILEEVERTHRTKLGWPENLVLLYQENIRASFPEAQVTGYEALIGSLTNDNKDRHVLAAAICGGCPLILTFNLRDFKAEHLETHQISATHPDDYLVTLYELEPKQVIAVLGEIAGRRRMETEDVLMRLGTVVPKFSSLVLLDLAK